MKLYGSISNRLSEGRNNVGKRYVGEDITLYYWLYFKTQNFKTQNEKNKYLNENRKGNYNTDLPERQPETWVYRYNGWRKKNNGKYIKISQKVSFGVRDYYYDWEF